MASLYCKSSASHVLFHSQTTHSLYPICHFHHKNTVACELTGLLSQLLEPEESKLGDGKIRDSNRITLITLLSEHGLTVNDMGIAKDR